MKITDFGIAGVKRAGSKGEQSSAGTVKFMAPELRSGNDISATKALDIWSLGIILFMIVFGEHPFSKKLKGKTTFTDNKFKLNFSSVKVTLEFKDLIRNMLDKDPEKRIRMFGILNHKWFEHKEISHENSEAEKGIKMKIKIFYSEIKYFNNFNILEIISVESLDLLNLQNTDLDQSINLKDMKNSQILPVCMFYF